MPVGRPFPAGVSGNPGGRPRTVKEVQAHASEFTIEAINRTVDVMRMASDPNVVRQAARDLLDRACGRPTQPITGGEGRPLEQEFPALMAALQRLNDPSAAEPPPAAPPPPAEVAPADPAPPPESGQG